jgi:Ribonuclease G/E
VKKIDITSPVQVADYLLNNKRMDLAQAESEHEKTIIVKGDNLLSGENYTITSYDERGRVID